MLCQQLPVHAAVRRPVGVGPVRSAVNRGTAQNFRGAPAVVTVQTAAPAGYARAVLVDTTTCQTHCSALLVIDAMRAALAMSALAAGTKLAHAVLGVQIVNAVVCADATAP